MSKHPENSTSLSRPTSNDLSMLDARLAPVRRVVLTYALVSFFWILLSDGAVDALFPDDPLHLKMHTWNMLNGELHHGRSVFCADAWTGAMSGQVAGHQLHFTHCTVF